MSNFKVKKMPPIKLVDLLKKKKTNLKQFLATTGIATYVTLEQKCEKMGVSAPSEADFHEALGTALISSPQEGVVVLDPPVLLKDTGEKIKIEDAKVVEEKPSQVEPAKPVEVAESAPVVNPQKTSKKKKDSSVEEA